MYKRVQSSLCQSRCGWADLGMTTLFNIPGFGIDLVWTDAYIAHMSSIRFYASSKFFCILDMLVTHYSLQFEATNYSTNKESVKKAHIGSRVQRPYCTYMSLLLVTESQILVVVALQDFSSLQNNDFLSFTGLSTKTYFDKQVYVACSH